MSRNYNTYSPTFLKEFEAILERIGQQDIKLIEISNKVLELKNDKKLSFFDIEALFRVNFLLNEMKTYNKRILDAMSDVVLP